MEPCKRVNHYHAEHRNDRVVHPRILQIDAEPGGARDSAQTVLSAGERGPAERHGVGERRKRKRQQRKVNAAAYAPNPNHAPCPNETSPVWPTSTLSAMHATPKITTSVALVSVSPPANSANGSMAHATPAMTTGDRGSFIRSAESARRTARAAGRATPAPSADTSRPRPPAGRNTPSARAPRRRS